MEAENVNQARDVDDAWQQYIDGLRTWEDLTAWRLARGLDGDYLKRVQTKTTDAAEIDRLQRKEGW